MEDRQYNSQKKHRQQDKLYKRNTTEKTKDRATQTLLKTEVNSVALEGSALLVNKYI